MANATPGAALPRTWRENGRASVRIASYEGQEMALDVDAAEAALVGTSIVAWPGWKLRLDGKPASMASYNHAFVGFLVPPGRHRAVLTYLPGSVVWGAALSLASLLAGFLLLWRSKARDRRPSGLPS
jgi:uncharacterized membrane protein YfhO